MVRILCERGADIHIRDNEGKTPFWHAADFGNLYRRTTNVDVLRHATMSVRVLAQHGAEIDTKPTVGNASLYDAIQLGNYLIN